MENRIYQSELKIPKAEVLRYLGYKSQNIDKNLENLIDETIEEGRNLLSCKYIVASYECDVIDNGVLIKGTNLILKGENIKNHLKYSNEVRLIAVTIGNNIEKRISLYEKSNLTKGIILDSVATTAVEEICDRLEENIKKEAEKKDLSITFRYSPGYGDLPLDVQKDFLNTLNAEKTIGLTVSNHLILFPRKSVTAIIGFIPKKKANNKRACEVCTNYENCKFRKEGDNCGI